MTPADRARQIDKEEFAAECAAVRQRAFAFIEKRRHEARCEIAHWLGREIPTITFRRFTQGDTKRPRKRRIFNKPTYTVDDVTMTKMEWAEHLGITKNALQQRIHRSGSLEAAVALGSGNQRYRLITYDGQTLGLKEWAKHLGLAPHSLWARINKYGEEAAIAMGGLWSRRGNDNVSAVTFRQDRSFDPLETACNDAEENAAKAHNEPEESERTNQTAHGVADPNVADTIGHNERDEREYVAEFAYWMAEHANLNKNAVAIDSVSCGRNATAPGYPRTLSPLRGPARGQSYKRRRI